MNYIRVGTINIKDNKINRNGGIREDGTNNAKLVSNIIKEKNFDLLGTQELTIKYVNELALFLPNYKFYGNYRCGNLLAKIPYNESNQIITKCNVLETKTFWLPWLANNFSDLKNSITKMSIMPRIATIVVFQDEEHRKVCMINTHLDYQIPSIQIRQLKALNNIIQKYSQLYDIILTRDFNMEIGNNIFDLFINDIKDKLQHVDVYGATWHGANGEETQVDHIFIPKNWKIKNAEIINLKETSDHDAICVNIKRR
jgi:endonuclease/exonuclease/phosphatase family metal-dependent hydrolase